MKRIKLFAKRKDVRAEDVEVEVEVSKGDRDAARATLGQREQDEHVSCYASSRESEESFSARHAKVRVPRRASSAGDISSRDRKLVQAGLCLMFSRSDTQRRVTRLQRLRKRNSSTVNSEGEPNPKSLVGTGGGISSARMRDLSVTSPEWQEGMVEKLAGDAVHEDVDRLLEHVLRTISGSTMSSSSGSQRRSPMDKKGRQKGEEPTIFALPISEAGAQSASAVS